MRTPKYMIDALYDTLAILKGHHAALECDWHIQPDGKAGDPCKGCKVIAKAERAIVRAVRQGPHNKAHGG